MVLCKEREMKDKLIILTVCNEPYVNIMVSLIETLNRFHPEIPVKMLALNLSDESKALFSGMHKNISFIEDKFSDFKDFQEERAY